ncbi:hypothetical protein KY284_000783 [Solanum tuberosum]|nr:hypothetical protein KY284_000783 [Solanum tuberosum]
MAVTEFVVGGGDYMGVWEETPKSCNWRSFSKMTVPIALRCNGSNDDKIASVIEAGELTCESNDLVISYQMNGRGKIHSTFIKNDRHVSLCMLDIGIDGSRPTLRIHVNVRPLIEPTNSFNGDNDSIGNERLGDHSKESLSDNSNESLGDHSMNIHDDPTNVENQPIDAEDLRPACCEEMQVQKELGSQSNHSFSDGTNLCMNQTFSNKNELQLLLAEAAAKKSFDFATVKTCTKYLKEIVIDELDLYFISDRHNGIAHGIVNVYNHAHYRYCMRHLGENLRINHHCGDYFYLYYNAAKAYSLEEFDNHFVEFKNKCPTAAVVLEHDIGFEKYSRAHFPGNRYDVMTTNIAESLNVMLIDEREYPVASIFNSIAKRLGELFRESHAYILKSMEDDNQFIVFGAGVTAYVDLLKKSCSYREYDLIKIPCAHTIAVFRSKRGNEYGMNIYEYSSPLYKVDVAYLLE